MSNYKIGLGGLQIQRDHYTHGDNIEFEFKEATLQLNKNGGHIFITGNIEIWNDTRQEPEKKLYVSLSEVEEEPAIASIVATKKESKVNTSLKVESFKLLVYPNSFDTQINVNFYLEKAVSISVTDMQGRITYKKNNLSFNKGTQTYSFNNNFHLALIF
ncbi:hypothetical protein [Pedobacter arcticus]|uniref:hypothetical protein n=1 Tax=Pedobacter arcticus TaxID=752140 RepID=UPI0002F48656|nr:hypothetical protein [Pedobacter arcticus]